MLCYNEDYETMVKRTSLFRSKTTGATPAEPPATEAKKTKRGKRLISGLFDEPTYRQFTTLAAELGMLRQNLLREALNDLFVKHGKGPIA
jgi:hypothetical protein